MEIQTFALPQSPQKSCPLFQLPAELRLRIFRRLLKRDTPLWPIVDGFMSFLGQDFQLSSQFLRTSQQLYHEGMSVLYQENTLVVVFMRQPPGHGPEEVNLKILRWTLVVSRMALFDSSKFGVFEQACRTSKRHDSSQRYAALQIKEKFPSLRRFRHMYFKIRCAEQIDVALACRIASDLLLDREVMMSINVAEKTGYSTQDDTSHLEVKGSTVLDWLDSCRILRCKSITFEADDKKHTKDIERTITSSEPVIDTWLDWYEVYWGVFERLPKAPGRNISRQQAKEVSFQACYRNELTILRERSLTYDVPTYRAAKKQLLQLASEWIESVSSKWQAELTSFADPDQ